MEPNGEWQENDKKAKRLVKRREQRRQCLLEETAEERETRLGKSREAWKKRLPRQKVSKGSIRESVIQERTNRLQKRKQDRATERVDERAKILEILRAHFHTATANENDQEWKDGHANEQLSMSVDPTVDISVPEADEDSESVHEAEGVSRNEYLHELEFVQKQMHSFNLDQEHLQHRQCTMCKETWPTQQNLASEVYICFRCKGNKESPKKFSSENDMDPEGHEHNLPQDIHIFNTSTDNLISYNLQCVTW
jgi:hypothetical protein